MKTMPPETASVITEIHRALRWAPYAPNVTIV